MTTFAIPGLLTTNGSKAVYPTFIDLDPAKSFINVLDFGAWESAIRGAGANLYSTALKRALERADGSLYRLGIILPDVTKNGIVRYTGIPRIDSKRTITFRDPNCTTFAFKYPARPSLGPIEYSNYPTVYYYHWESRNLASAEIKLLRTGKKLPYQRVADAHSQEIWLVSTYEQILPGDKIEITVVNDVDFGTVKFEIPLDRYENMASTVVLDVWNSYTASSFNAYWTGVKLSRNGLISVASALNRPSETSKLYGAIQIDQSISYYPNTGPLINYQHYYNTPTNLTTFALSDDGYKMVAAAYGGYVYTSLNTGGTWTQRLSIQEWQGVASSADGTKLVAVATNSRIYTSADSGVTWTPREASRLWTCVASSSDGNFLIAGVENGPLYLSSNAGVSWYTREQSRLWFSITMSDTGLNVVAADCGGQLHMSTDSGLTWNAVGPTRLWQSVSSSSTGQNIVAACLGTGADIFISTDYGFNWSALKKPIKNWNNVSMNGAGTKFLATTEDEDFIFQAAYTLL